MAKHKLTTLQISILRELWARREATVTELWEGLHDQRGLAPTTLATILSRLERRGVVAHRTRARQFVYRAMVTAEEVQHSMVGELTASLFEGDVPALVNHLLTAQDVSPGDLARIRAMIEEAERTKEPAP
jgi:predicted transcriptional regulator